MQFMEIPRKTLGIIGGLGPMATAYFLELLTKMSQAATDQEHMEILLHSKPSIPDRTSYILGKSMENPLPDMAETGRELVRMGAEEIAIPCITAHFFHNELEKQIGVPVVHAIRETAAYLKERGVRTAGILATDGTVASGLFQKEFSQYGIVALMPSDEGQAMIMDIIYHQVKMGKKGNPAQLEVVAESLRQQGAEVVLLGCTELSLLKRDFALSAGYLDVMEVLARKAVKDCGVFRKEYEELITDGIQETAEGFGG